MLQIKNIKKQYVTGDLVQNALNDVSFNLRDNEFVAILGPSGSGKTTLLNVIGGLDRYDSGDIIINGISTKKYTDRDWDSYRNHTIGFVFQSYNLIPHQSVLANVELALTISGISSAERKRRAIEALEKVGLKEQIHKKPNQMSGGQMQRVAIARALVNDPEILLADEPTGALDSETSVQVMDLLKEVAKDRLVVLVTHNDELAEEYTNRIIRFQDGKILGDTNPLEVEETAAKEPEHKNMGRSSMSLLTSLSLSFNNLKTKKGRTFLTAFAGSIGIIGIALILALSSGVNDYINSIQKDTMASYPISIQMSSIDLTSVIGKAQDETKDKTNHPLDKVYSDPSALEVLNTATTSIKENNLTAFKKYLDDPKTEIHDAVGENGIVYSYKVAFDAFSKDSDGTLVNTDGSTLTENDSQMSANMSQNNEMMASISNNSSSNNFSQLLPDKKTSLTSKTVTESYDLVKGSWPKNYNEVVLVLDSNNEIPATALYQLGLLPSSEYNDLVAKMNKGEEATVPEHELNYEDLLAHTFQIIPESSYYELNDKGLYAYLGDDKKEVEDLLNSALSLKVAGIIRPKEDASYTGISTAVGYTKALTDYLMAETAKAPVVKAQEASKDKNVVNGMSFEPGDDAKKEADAKEYLANLGISDKAKMFKDMMTLMVQTGQMTKEQAASSAEMDETRMAAMLDQYLADPDSKTLLSIYDNYVSPGTYDENMQAFGYVSEDAPSGIDIYADSFEDKEKISDAIADYNKTVDEADKITYTDYVGLMMSSVTTIVNVISYVLIAFVGVSLVVSSIMIGIITFISVLERTKEIGILRAIGASKRNISQVFNAETFIVGLLAGLIGVGITYLLIIPINAIIHSVAGIDTVNASLPIGYALILVVLSMFLTLIAGLIPAKKAAKKDPVIALRSE